MKSRYPIYIISKGRYENCLTSKALEHANIDYHIVIEPQEYDLYASVIDPSKILVLPFSNLGQGSIPARNWVWDHSVSWGCARHWILDDNIRDFYRLNKNIKYRITDNAIFKSAEEFVDRYINVKMAGFEYEMFVLRKKLDNLLQLTGACIPVFLLTIIVPTGGVVGTMRIPIYRLEF